MKKLQITISLLFLATLYLGAQNNLTVKVTNLSAKKGVLEVGLFNKKEGFLKPGNQLLKKRIQVVENSGIVTFSDLPKGNYAVAIFQDENLNHKCDTNFMGFPLEGFGFSNNIKPVFSAPRFDQTKVWVEGNKNIEVKLIR